MAWLVAGSGWPELNHTALRSVSLIPSGDQPLAGTGSRERVGSVHVPSSLCFHHVCGPPLAVRVTRVTSGSGQELLRRPQGKPTGAGTTRATSATQSPHRARGLIVTPLHKVVVEDQISQHRHLQSSFPFRCRGDGSSRRLPPTSPSFPPRKRFVLDKNASCCYLVLIWRPGFLV